MNAHTPFIPAGLILTLSIAAVPFIAYAISRIMSPKDKDKK